MKTLRALLLILLAGVLLPAGLAAADAPSEINGIRLGGNIKDYQDLLDMSTALPLRNQPYLMEVELKPQPGVRGGLVMYGNCADPGRIIRIKIKYDDLSKRFYDEYLDRLKSRYGGPEQWVGDSFGMLYAWKWGFVDKNNSRVTMILKHNTVDPEEGIGTSIKLTIPEQSQKEMACYDKAHPEPAEKTGMGRGRHMMDWRQILPK